MGAIISRNRDDHGRQPSSHLDLDGRQLKLLIVLVEEGSITHAAERIGITQSAVSHMLARLRELLGDPLFVKAGRGVVATPRAVELAGRARVLLDGMRTFVDSATFDPQRYDGEFVIAANDLQRDLLLPPLLARLRAQSSPLRLRIISSHVPTADMLREARCRLILTPRPPPAADIVQRRLFDDEYVCYYDAAKRSAPATTEEYLAAEHVTIVHESRGPLDIDRHLAESGVNRRFAAVVPNFSGVASFLRGSDFLATLPRLLGSGLLRDFASSPLPLRCPRMPMYMVWHQRDQLDPMHRWLRGEIDAVVAALPILRTTAS